MRIAFYVLAAVLIIVLGGGFAYLIMSQMNRGHRVWQRSAAAIQVAPALPSEQAKPEHRSA